MTLDPEDGRGEREGGREGGREREGEGGEGGRGGREEREGGEGSEKVERNGQGKKILFNKPLFLHPVVNLPS